MAELVLTENTLITSKTDLKGFITYANKDFLKYAGYKPSEILYKNHNIIRHPDMPRCAFWLLWQMLGQKQEFFGYVKNRAKSGDFYWVFASIAPTFDEKGNVVDYYSVRRKPSKKGVEAADGLYKELIKAEGASRNIQAGVDLLLKVLNGADYNEFILSLQLGEAK